VIDLAPDSSLIDAVAEAHESHRLRKVPLIVDDHKAI
jgi:hypothetical protein